MLPKPKQKKETKNDGLKVAKYMFCYPLLLTTLVLA